MSKTTPRKPKKIPVALMLIRLPERPEDKMSLIVPRDTPFLPDLLLTLQAHKREKGINWPNDLNLADHGPVFWSVDMWAEVDTILAAMRRELPEGQTWKPVLTILFSDGNISIQEFVIAHDQAEGSFPTNARAYLRQLLEMYAGVSYPPSLNANGVNAMSVRNFEAMYSHLKDWAVETLKLYDI